MKASNYFGIVICGICLGILTGISISPIIQSIITSFITIIVTILSLTTGVHETNQNVPSKILSKFKLVNILPTAFFIFFFTIGCFVGIKVRTSNLFGDSPNRQYAELKEIGFSNGEIKEILLRKYLGENTTEKMYTMNESILFSSEIENKLDPLRLKTGKQLEAELRALNVSAVDSFISVTNDSISIEALKVFLCTLYPKE